MVERGVPGKGPAPFIPEPGRTDTGSAAGRGVRSYERREPPPVAVLALCEGGGRQSAPGIDQSWAQSVSNFEPMSRGLTRRRHFGNNIRVHEVSPRPGRPSSKGEAPAMPTRADETIEALLLEKRRFKPPRSFASRANVSNPGVYRKADRDFEKFWAGFARELEWMKPWRKVLDWKPPRAKWFVGGKLNASVNCVDRHARGPRANKAALIWEGEPGDQRTITYRELLREVGKFANVLKSLGVKKGDRVTLYMPMIPELPIAMLGCARIGAIHSVVFGGFSAESLRDRINDQGAKVLVTADGGWRRGNVVP